MEPELLEWAEDICEVCGAHVGYGVRLFHLERCDEHSDEEGHEYESDSGLTAENAENPQSIAKSDKHHTLRLIR